MLLLWDLSIGGADDDKAGETWGFVAIFPYNAVDNIRTLYRFLRK